jgi:hypothetical protein
MIDYLPSIILLIPIILVTGLICVLIASLNLLKKMNAKLDIIIKKLNK